MTIRYMEGFESVAQAQDFTQRGVTPALNTIPGTGPARYAEGKAGVRALNVPNSSVSVISRVVGTVYPSTALSLSSMVYATTLNNGSYFRINTVYRDGTYVSINTTNTLRISTTTDLNFWPDPTIINATTGYVAEDILYDTVRDLWTVSGYAGGGNQAVFATSATLSSTNWAVQALSTGVGNSSNSKIYQDPTTGNLFSTAYQSIQTRVAGATSWSTAYANSGNTMMGGAAFDGVKWIVPNASSNSYMTSPNGAVWTASGTVANSSASSIATKPGTGVPGTIVIGRAQLTPLAYSLDGGVTFTNAAVPNLADANGVYVAYGSGVFVGIPQTSTNTVSYISEDGVSWTVLPFNHAGANCTSLKYTNGQFIASFGPAVAYSTDGRTWAWTQSGSYGSTGATYGLIDAFGGSFFQMTFGLVGSATAGVTFGGGGTTGISSTSIGDATTFANRWANVQTTLIRNAATQYTIDYQLDGVSVRSQAVTFPMFYNSGGRTLTNAAAGNGAYDGAGTSVFPCAAGTPGVMYSKDRGLTWTYVALAMGAGRRVVWTGERFIAFGTGVAFASPNGVSWTSLSGFPAVTVQSAASNGSGSILAPTPVNGEYVFSTDHGTTWNTYTTLNTGYTYSAVEYVAGTWIVAPSYAASGDRAWAYGSDGLAWEFVDAAPSWNVAGYSAQNGSVAAFTINTGGTTRVTPRPGLAPLFEVSNLGGFGVNIGSAAGYFAASFSGAGLYYSVDGLTWVEAIGTSGLPNGIFFTPVSGQGLLRNTSAATTVTLFYPELTNVPLMLYWNGGSFSSVDDIVATDLASPNAGPQGEVRILTMPSDEDVQAEWNKVPSTSPTNAYAATRMPVSTTASSYVDANEVGLKDKYGTSAFTFPTGYRPLAMQVEGFFERVFPNVPVVRLGLEGVTTEVQTDPIPVSSNVGQTTFVSKVVETNPDGGSWTRTNINTTKITVEKTA